MDTKKQQESKISQGLFGLGYDFVEKYQSLDTLFVKNKFSTYFFEMSNDSMAPNIMPGEILVVDRSIDDFHNRVCIIHYENQLSCKRILKTTEHSIILRSDNSKYKDIHLHDFEELIFWGVVIARAGFVK